MTNINEDLSKEKCKTLANYLCMYVRSQLKTPFTDLPQLMIGRTTGQLCLKTKL